MRCGGCAVLRGGWPAVEFSNLPHDYAEPLELVFVFVTMLASLGLMVLFGRWWQR